MSAASDFMENKLVDFFFRAQTATINSKTVTWSATPTYYFALFTSAPSDSGGGTECSGNSYARASIQPSLTNFTGTHGTTTGASSGTGGQTSNAVDITFAPPTSTGWGTVTSWGIFDADTSGNLMFWGTLTSNKTINGGDTVKFPAGQFIITVA
jgi:hypothetical protein